MRIAMANDHAGTALKNELAAWLRSEGHEVVDFGTHDDLAADLPDFIYPASIGPDEQPGLPHWRDDLRVVQWVLQAPHSQQQWTLRLGNLAVNPAS